jgi:hypothetical protein
MMYKFSKVSRWHRSSSTSLTEVTVFRNCAALRVEFDDSHPRERDLPHPRRDLLHTTHQNRPNTYQKRPTTYRSSSRIRWLASWCFLLKNVQENLSTEMLEIFVKRDHIDVKRDHIDVKRDHINVKKSPTKPCAIWWLASASACFQFTKMSENKPIYCRKRIHRCQKRPT